LNSDRDHWSTLLVTCDDRPLEPQQPPPVDPTPTFSPVVGFFELTTATAALCPDFDRFFVPLLAPSRTDLFGHTSPATARPTCCTYTSPSAHRTMESLCDILNNSSTMDQLTTQLSRQLLASSTNMPPSSVFSSALALNPLSPALTQLLQITSGPTMQPDQTSALAALLLSQPALFQSLTALSSAAAVTSGCNAPLTPPTSNTERSLSPLEDHRQTTRMTPSPPAHSPRSISSQAKVDQAPLDLSLRSSPPPISCNGAPRPPLHEKQPPATEPPRKRRNSKASKNVAASISATASTAAQNITAAIAAAAASTSGAPSQANGLFRALEAQLAIAGISLAQLSPNSNAAMLDSPPSSESLSEPDHDAHHSTSIAEQTEAAFKLLEGGQMSASMLEPEVIISTDPLDDEPQSSGGSQMKRKLDAMLYNGPSASEPQPDQAAPRQFGQLSLLSPHVSTVSNGHLIVSPPSARHSPSAGLVIKSNSTANRINTPLSAATIETLSAGASLLLNPVMVSSANIGASNLVANPSSSSSSSLSPSARSDAPIQVPALPVARSAVASSSAVSPNATARPVGIKDAAGELVYPCDLCDQMFSAPDRLNKHKASRHKQRKSVPQAGVITVDGATLAVAMATGVVFDKQKGFYCTICCRGFSRSDMLTRHFRLHSGLKPYTCDICSQVFSRSDHLATHKRTHSGEKPYKCTVCDYAACRRDMITRHMKTHAAR
jgi:hypothetical protein